MPASLQHMVTSLTLLSPVPTSRHLCSLQSGHGHLWALQLLAKGHGDQRLCRLSACEGQGRPSAGGNVEGGGDVVARAALSCAPRS